MGNFYVTDIKLSLVDVLGCLCLHDIIIMLLSYFAHFKLETKILARGCCHQDLLTYMSENDI